MFTLKIGVGASFGHGQWGGNINSTGLLFKSMEDVETVIQLAHPPVWIICEIPEGEDSWHDKEVKVSSVVEETRRQAKETKEKYLIEMNEVVKKINQQPAIIPLFFGISLKLVIHRDAASFDPMLCRTVVVPIRCKLIHDGEEVLSYFYPGEYISKDGKVLGKKLHNFSNWHRGLNPGDVGCLVDKLKMVQALIYNLGKGEYNPKDFSLILSKKGVTV